VTVESTAITSPNEERIQAAIVLLQGRLDKITVVNTDDEHREMASIKIDANTYIKNVGFELDPGISKAEEVVRHLKNQKAKFVDPATAIVKAASQRIADKNERERLAAEAETRRRNEEKRVAAQREADEKKRIADEKATADKKAADKKAEADRLAAQKKADEDKKAADKKAEEDQKTRQKEIDKARESGVLKKREADKLAKEAAEKSEKDKKAAEEKAEKDKKVADEKAARDKQKADEDAARLREQADKDAAALMSNVKTENVLANRPVIAGIRGGGTWKFKVIDITKIPKTLLYPNPNEDGEFDPEKFPRIGDMVRKTKDKEQAEAQCPGIEVYFRDR
jgi:hypothetical protein